MRRVDMSEYDPHALPFWEIERQGGPVTERIEAIAKLRQRLLDWDRLAFVEDALQENMHKMGGLRGQITRLVGIANEASRKDIEYDAVTDTLRRKHEDMRTMETRRAELTIEMAALRARGVGRGRDDDEGRSSRSMEYAQWGTWGFVP